MKSFFKAPLLDPSVEDGQLAAWIDSNTMQCHKNLLPLLAKARPQGGAPSHPTTATG